MNSGRELFFSFSATVLIVNASLPNDAALFQALHEAIVAHDSPERRDGERHRYEHPLLVAPVAGEVMPDQSEFHHVMCHDLSLQGFSFTSLQPHECPYLVVALGRAPFTFTLAQIVRREKEAKPQGEEYALGCRFIKRLR